MRQMQMAGKLKLLVNDDTIGRLENSAHSLKLQAIHFLGKEMMEFVDHFVQNDEL